MSGPLPTSDGSHDRADWRLLLRAQYGGWPVRQEVRLRAIEQAERDLEHDDGRVRCKAREFLLLCDSENRRLAEFIWKTDEGEKDRNPKTAKRKRIILDGDDDEDEEDE